MTFPQPKKKSLAVKASKGKEKKVVGSSDEDCTDVKPVVLLVRSFGSF